ncbi:MAG: uroporphyrinogen decarboxylase family protein [Spirochaetales bacterium]|nr:uroporphyrinogen decarboxylase family protein [Spirochaetales bacterium]
MNSRKALEMILNREDPGRFVYAPNYWQWITHRFNHNSMPEELSQCTNQLEMIQQENLDVFSRNIYSDPYKYWFGGLSEKVLDGIETERIEEQEGGNTLTTIRYKMKEGVLEERLRYCHEDSTLVQDKFLIDDYETQLPLLENLLERTSWKFSESKYREWDDRCGDSGFPVAGEFFSPLKMLHLYLGPVETTFLLSDNPETALRLMKIHEESQLDLMKEMTASDVKAVMAMDNLDSMFHPPHYVEAYSASFYERAASVCHENDAAFFIHACGQQKANLKLISDLGVDGLEGVAYPPLGDVTLDEAMDMTGSNFIISGGISAAETTNLKGKDDIHSYIENLLNRMKPYRNRFILSASCNTAIETPWPVLREFHNAWRQYGS